jgi:predicted acyl esterase
MTRAEHRDRPEPAYEVKLVQNVRIPMSDGISLAADFHLPVTAGRSERFPAIIEYTPYHKNNNAVYGPRATRYPYFAAHGYVFVNVDIRGTGDSEGFNTSPTSPEEVRDNVDVIRWCARQPWCDGNVGMIGISYTAGVCYDAARLAPQELKAIVVCQMCSDWHDGMACPGGTPRPFVYENYAPLMAAYHFAPPHPDLVGPRWAEIWQQRLDHSRPWGVAYLENLLDGPFWEARLLRGHEDRVKAATFLIGGWCDWYPDDLLRVFSRLQCPKRVLIGPWTHNYPENGWPLPRLNDRYECLRWFDKHLKGIDTDPARPLENEPPVTLFVREFTRPEALRRLDEGVFRHEAAWPPERVKPLALHIAEQGVLRPEGGGGRPAPEGMSDLVYRADVGIAAGRYVIGQLLPGWGMPDDQRLDEPFSLVYTADPLPFDPRTELLGGPEAHLFVSCAAGVAFLSVKLCDVAPDGTSVLVTKGVLNLTHRNSHAKPEPLEPGKVYEVRVPLLAAGYRFRPGHRLRVLVAAADFQNAWPTPLPHTLTVHHGPGHPSRIVLPLAGPQDPPLPEPSFRASDFPPLPPDQVPTPQYGVDRDLIGQTMTVSYTTRSGIGINRSRYTVRINRPAEAVVVSEFDYPLERPGLAVLVHSQCVTRSDEAAFHHLTHVEVTVNGRPHWGKSWAVSVPRPCC